MIDSKNNSYVALQTFIDVTKFSPTALHVISSWCQLPHDCFLNFLQENGIVVDFQNILAIHHIKRICPQLMSDTFLSSTLKQQMLSKHFHYQYKRETMAIVLWQLMKQWF